LTHDESRLVQVCAAYRQAEAEFNAASRALQEYAKRISINDSA
jgi:hypothetical protein